MSSSKSSKSFLVSTISDNPMSIFSNLSRFNSSVISGIHFDVMDGIFVPRLGLYPELLAEIHKHTLIPIEVHCMLKNSFPYIKLFSESGAKRVIFHVETSERLPFLISEAKSLNLEVGIAINPDTPIPALLPYLQIVDFILAMAVYPGGKKMPLLPKTYERILEIDSLLDSVSLDIPISVDGGVTFENISELNNCGVSRFICGSGTVFSPNNSVAVNLEKLRTL